jgi:tetratricopeptide (TPR) repeat protein
LDGLPTVLRARTLAAVGVMARQSGEYDRSMARLEQALALFEACGDENGKARVLCDRGRTLYRKNDLEQAKAVTLEAMERALQLHDLPLAANAGLGLGLIEWRNNCTDDARRRFEECRLIFRDRGYLREEAQAINNLGLIFHQLGEYAQALPLFRHALDLQENIGDRGDLRNVYNNVADCSLRIGDFSSAESNYLKLMRLAEEDGDPRAASTACAGLAEVAMLCERSEAACESAQRALEHAAKAAGGIEEGVAWRVLADSSLLAGDRNRARECYRQCVAILRTCREPEELRRAERGLEAMVGP